MGDKNFAGSVLEAINPIQLSKKFVLSLVSLFMINTTAAFDGFVLATKQLFISQGLLAKIAGFFSTIWNFSKTIIGESLSLVWNIVNHPMVFLFESPLVTIIKSSIILAGLVGLVYQPVSFVLTILDGKTGSLDNVFIKTILSIIVVLVLSVITNYLSTGIFGSFSSTQQIVVSNNTAIENMTLQTINNTVSQQMVVTL